jgi:mRNA-degrading endonuclease YafQ of YafQ-DinJ toxin-antitoxin module
MARHPLQNRTALFEESPLFEPSFEKAIGRDKSVLQNFVTFKNAKSKRPPDALPNGMRDHKLNPPLGKYSQCHLAADECLVYSDKNNIVKMIVIVPHDMLKGPRQKALSKAIKKAGY